jgi:hypothetical protein
MSLHFAMTAAQTADLERLLAAQQDRRSPQYRKFLTPEEYAARFGLDSAGIGTIARWLENSGFSDLQVARGRTSVSFSGTAARVEAAFHTAIRQYALNGETHFANASDPQLPKALEGLVESVHGLHNFQLKPHIMRPQPRYNLGSGADNFLAPDDWQTIYNVKPLYGAGIDGTGVTIAVVGQSDVQLTDLQAFRTAAGLPPNNPTVVVPPGRVDPGIQSTSGDETESDLDLEWSGGIAKNANILFITASATSGNGVFDAIFYAINNNVAPILSISYGGCEKDLSAADANTLANLFRQGSAQGMTIVAASGDGGGAACDTASTAVSATHGLAVDFPADLPYVTGVGGTELAEKAEFFGSYWSATNNGNGGSALSYIPEIAWNDGFRFATGGGASTLFVKPAWQTGLGVPNDGQRDVPDLAFTASPLHDPLLICGHSWCTGGGFRNSAGGLYLVGGTSAGAPAFAGVLALLVQETGGRLGNINPNLYSLAQVSANAFHDVTTGNNYARCTSGTPDCLLGSPGVGYPASAGYDQTTGLGSIDVYNFVEQWSGDIRLTASPATLTVQRGSSATANIAVAPQNNFHGDVSFSCSVSNSLTDVSCSVPPTTVNTSGSTTVTISAAVVTRTPFWRRLPQMPIQRRGWPLTLCMLAVTVWMLLRRRYIFQRAVYVWGAISLCAITIVAVGCGGGSSGGGSKTVYGPLSLICSLPVAKQSVAYNGACTAAGGNSVYSYSVSSGILPYGLSLNGSTGAISGTPNVAGISSPFTVMASDSESPAQSATQTVTKFVVNGSTPLSVGCTLSGVAVVGHAFTANCSTNGGTPPASSYSIDAGVLPAGLSLDSTQGSISGKPTTPGKSSFSLRATDSGVPPQNASYPFNFEVLPPSPLFVNCYVPSPVVHIAYHGACGSFGGTPPVTYSLAGGFLPAGLSLDSQGVISGTPQHIGSSSFSVTVKDSGTPPQTNTSTVTLLVSPLPSENGTVTVTATSGGIVNTVSIAVAVP